MLLSMNVRETSTLPEYWVPLRVLNLGRKFPFHTLKHRRA